MQEPNWSELWLIILIFSIEKNKAPIERYKTISWLLADLPWTKIALRALSDKIELNQSQVENRQRERKRGRKGGKSNKFKKSHIKLICTRSIRNVFHSIFSLNQRKTKIISRENKSKNPRERREIYENISNAHIVRHWAREKK